MSRYGEPTAVVHNASGAQVCRQTTSWGVGPFPKATRMRWRRVVLIAVSVLGMVSVLWQNLAPVAEADGVEQDTARYIQQVNIRNFEWSGADFVNPRFSPLRLGVPLESLNATVHYDYKRVAAVTRSLGQVDRERALQHIFAEVTQRAATSTERHLAVLKFLQKSSFHNVVQPLYADGTMVTDPLVVLALSEMHCGNVARLAVDLFEAVGIRGRLVQLASHVVAEVYYDGGWHYMDSDIFGNGETVVKADGTVPSVVELSRMPYLLDTLSHYRELPYTGAALKISAEYPSWFYFSKEAYGPATGEPFYYEKVASETQKDNRYYGWNFVNAIPDSQRALYAMKPSYQPGAVSFTQIGLGRIVNGTQEIRLEWSEANDQDHDLLGYHLFVSTRSRGWAYGRYDGPASLRRYVNDLGGWKPDMYEKLYTLPPHDIRLATTPRTAIFLALPPGQTYFITVMPYDAHGKEVGKVLYQMSDEIRLEL